MRALNVVLALVVSALIGFAVFEGGLRLTRFAPEESANQFDTELGWSKRPGASIERSTSEFDLTLEINEQGLRDDPMPDPKKPEGVFRVLCLGDSFTMGYTVERKDLFIDILEDWWQFEGRPVELLNAGTEGYSTDQEARWLELHGEELEPDLVLVFPYENDIYWNGQKSYLRYPKPRYTEGGRLEARKLHDPGPHRWTENWATTRALQFFVSALRGKKTGPIWFQPEGGKEPILREFAPLLTEAPDFLTAPPEDPLGRTKGCLTALKKTSDKLGAKLVVVPIPAHSDVSSEFAAHFGEHTLGLGASAWDPSRPVDFFLSTATELGIECLDARPTLRAREEGGTELYYRVDWHLNPEGNRTLARYLHDTLDSPTNSILPPSMAAKTRHAEPPADEGTGGVPRWLMVYGLLWLLLSASYKLTYRTEKLTTVAPGVAGMLALVFGIFFGGRFLAYNLPPEYAGIALTAVVLGIIGFLLYKLGSRIGTVMELIAAFITRGHWYLLPLLVVLLSIGSLLVVAASSPFVAPFIYTLF